MLMAMYECIHSLATLRPNHIGGGKVDLFERVGLGSGCMSSR